MYTYTTHDNMILAKLGYNTVMAENSKDIRYCMEMFRKYSGTITIDDMEKLKVYIDTTRKLSQFHHITQLERMIGKRLVFLN